LLAELSARMWDTILGGAALDFYGLTGH
jgi:hypothetical protein